MTYLRISRLSATARLLTCGVGGFLMLVAGVVLVSPAAALITAGVLTVAATAAIAYLRGAR